GTKQRIRRPRVLYGSPCGGLPRIFDPEFSCKSRRTGRQCRVAAAIILTLGRSAMRSVRPLALLLLAGSLVHAQESLPTLDLHNLKFGQVGRFKAQTDHFYFEIRRIRGDKDMVVAGVFVGQDRNGNRKETLEGDFFCVRGLSTKGLIDDKRIELTG